MKGFGRKGYAYLDGNYCLPRPFLKAGKLFCMNRLCIICFEEKPLHEFNKEHVFPETIGGRLCIRSVCKYCNEGLGKNVDTPFLNHITIACLRNHHGLSRGKNRGIKSPLKHYNKPDDDFYFEFRNGNITKHLKPTRKDFTENGTGRIEYSMDEVDFTEERKFDIIQRVANDFGVRQEEIEFRVDKTYHPPEQRLFIAPDSPLIMEAVKVAHELASEHVPGYTASEAAKISAEALRTGPVNKEFMVMASNPLLWVSISMKGAYWQKAFDGHFVLIGGVQGVGLVAAVKFFSEGLVYPLNQLIILSFEAIFMDVNPSLIVNDFKGEKPEQLNHGISITGGFRFPKKQPA